MVFVGVLPYTYSEDGTLLLLLGQERKVKGWVDSLKWSGFGGKLEEKDSSFIEGAAREAYEESMGAFGSKDEIIKLIHDNNDEDFQRYDSHTYLMKLEYSKDISRNFNTMYKYVLDATDNMTRYKSKDGYFEKVRMEWINIHYILQNTDEFRHVFIKGLTKALSEGYF